MRCLLAVLAWLAISGAASARCPHAFRLRRSLGEDLEWRPRDLVFSADSSKLAASDAGPTDERAEIAVWDLKDGTRRTLWGPSRGGPSLHIAFSPTGKTVAAITMKGILLAWDAGTGRTLYRVPDAGAGLAFSPDGSTLATATKTRVILREPATGRVVLTLQGFGADPFAIAFTPDGKRIVLAHHGGLAAVALDGSPWVRLAAKVRPLRDMPLRFSRGGQLILVPHVAVVDMGTGLPLAGAPRNFGPADLSSDARLALEQDGGGYVLVDVSSGRRRGCVASPRDRGLGGLRPGPALSPDGRTIAAGENTTGLLLLWSVDVPNP